MLLKGVKSFLRFGLIIGGVKQRKAKGFNSGGRGVSIDIFN